jgi:hypothetical protein
MKKKQKLKDSDLKAPTDRFYTLLKRATQPLSEEEAQKEERKKSGGNISKRTHQRKEEDASD